MCGVKTVAAKERRAYVGPGATEEGSDEQRFSQASVEQEAARRGEDSRGQPAISGEPQTGADPDCGNGKGKTSGIGPDHTACGRRRVSRETVARLPDSKISSAFPRNFWGE